MEASSLHAEHQLIGNTIGFEQTQIEYSGSARISIDSIQFINDPVVGSQSSDPAYMPLRQAGCIEYSFTQQETKYLTTENTCVIDNLVGEYGKELKLNKDKIN